MDRKRYQDTSFNQEVMGVSFSLGYQISDYVSQVWGYRIQTDKVSNIRRDASIYVKQQDGSKLLSALSQEIAYDRRDSKINPTQGYVLRLSNDFAGLGGTISYLKNQLSGAYYYPYFGRYGGLGVGTCRIYVCTLGSDNPYCRPLYLRC